MSIERLTIFNFNDIKTKSVSIKHQNAFIFPDGKFCLAKGYTGKDSSSQLESSALQISREIINLDIRTKYDIYLQDQIRKGVSLEEINQKRLYFLRHILIQYYGYGLFARIQRVDVAPEIENFWDCSMLPDPKYHGKEATEEQIKTLKALFELNDDGTVLPSLNEATIEDSIKKILKHKKIRI